MLIGCWLVLPHGWCGQFTSLDLGLIHVVRYGDDIEFSWSASYIHVSSEPYPIDNYGGPFSWMAVNESTEAQYPLSDTQIADSAIKQLEDARIQFEHDPDNTPPFFIAVGFHRP